MAVDHWWFGLLIDDAEYELFRPGFEAASAKANLSERSRAALEAWERQPSAFDDGGSAKGEDVNAFIAAFDLPGFEAFAGAFIVGELAGHLTEERLARFVSVRQRAPVGVLWQALGAARAKSLPGAMGNMLLRPSEVPGAYALTASAYAGTTSEELFRNALRSCGSSVFAEETLREVVTFLPDCLDRATREKKGFLSLARVQV